MRPVHDEHSLGTEIVGAMVENGWREGKPREYRAELGLDMERRWPGRFTPGDGLRQTMSMPGDSGTRYSFGEARPYEVVDSLSELRGPQHGVLRLPTEPAWGGRREFDLDDDYDRSAADKIVLDEGTARNLRELVNGRLLVMIWPHVRPARPVHALWERVFPQLRASC